MWYQTYQEAGCSPRKPDVHGAAGDVPRARRGPDVRGLDARVLRPEIQFGFFQRDVPLGAQNARVALNPGSFSHTQKRRHSD